MSNFVGSWTVRDPRAADLGRDLHAHHDARDHLVLDAAVETLGVLSDDDEVHVVVTRLQARQRTNGADGRIQIQPLTEGDVDAAKTLADRCGARAFQRDLEVLDGLERLDRHDIAAFRESSDPGVVL